MVAGTGSFAATLSSLGTVATVDSSEAMYDLSNAAQSGFLFFQGWI
jgi:predicted RNA methylase